MLVKFLAAAIFFIMQTSAQAHGIFWYDMNSDLPMWKKVVIFPLANSNDKNNYLISRDENSLLFWENKYLMERFEKKIKNLHTIRLAPGIKEKDEILVDKFSVLLKPYPDEKSRATAVFEQTGADMYILPRFKQNHVQVDISPRTEVEVQISSWTEIKDSPNDDGIYNKTTWTVQHVIPEKEVYTRIMELEFEGYDTDANKVLLFTDSRRENTNEKHMFRDIAKYLRKDFSELKSDKHNGKDKGGAVTLGFGNINFPSEIGGDEYILKGAYFGMKFEALDKLKGVNVITDATNDKALNYIVKGKVNWWNLKSMWNPPSASTSPKVVKVTETKWKDDKGKEHTMTTTDYVEEIYDHFAHWSFWWSVGADFQLINAKTGQTVISVEGAETNDKPMDAYRKILRNFYEQVNKHFKR